MEDAVNGEVSIDYTQVSDDPLARIHYILRTVPGSVIEPDPQALQKKLTEAARRWEDGLVDALVERWGESEGARLAARYGTTCFPAGYKDAFSAQDSLLDIEKIERLHDFGDMGMILYRPADAEPSTFRLKVFNHGTAVALSDMLPMLEHMGLKVIDERPHRFGPVGGDVPVIWVQDLGLADPDGRALTIADFSDQFRETFARASRGQIESDGFNQLVLAAGLRWRQVVVLRAICKYLRQAAIAFSQAYMEATLAKNPAITGLLVALFEARFDPNAGAGRDKTAAAIVRKIGKRLDAVENLDEDRILRRFLMSSRPRCGQIFTSPETTAKRNPTSRSRSAAAMWTNCRCPGPTSKSSFTARAWKASICAVAGFRAAVSGGRTAGKISAPKFWG